MEGFDHAWSQRRDGGDVQFLPPEDRVPAGHPLRAIRVIVDRSSAELDGYFNQVYSDLGRPSIPQSPCSQRYRGSAGQRL